MKITAIIMAAGLSKRMGENKLLLKLKGKEVYQIILDEVSKIDFDQVIVVSSYEEILNKAKEMGFEGVKNDNSEVGKSETIKLGVDNAADGNALMFFVADQVLLKEKTIKKIIEAFEKNPELIAYPVSQKRRGAPVIFPSRLRQELGDLNGDEGGVVLINDENKNPVAITDETELWDIDTKETYEKIREIYEWFSDF